MTTQKSPEEILHTFEWIQGEATRDTARRAIEKALQSQQDELAKLKRQLEVARKGLEYYASHKSWHDSFDSEIGGKRARNCLAQIERIGEE